MKERRILLMRGIDRLYRIPNLIFGIYNLVLIPAPQRNITIFFTEFHFGVDIR